MRRSLPMKQPAAMAGAPPDAPATTPQAAPQASATAPTSDASFIASALQAAKELLQQPIFQQPAQAAAQTTEPKVAASVPVAPTASAQACLPFPLPVAPAPTSANLVAMTQAEAENSTRTTMAGLGLTLSAMPAEAAHLTGLYAEQARMQANAYAAESNGDPALIQQTAMHAATGRASTDAYVAQLRSLASLREAAAKPLTTHTAPAPVAASVGEDAGTASLASAMASLMKERDLVTDADLRAAAEEHPMLAGAVSPKEPN